MRRLLLSLALLLGLSVPVCAQTIPYPTANILSQNFSFTAANQSTILPLNGQSTCAVTVTSVGGGVTLVPSASSDNGVTYTTVSSIGSGSITASGIYIGLIAPYGLTQFQLQATALTSGTVTGTITCSVAVSFNSNGFVQLSPGSQQSGNVNISGTLTAGASTLGSSAAANTVNGSLLAYANNGGTTPPMSNGELGSSIDNQTGELTLGGSSHHVQLDYNVTNTLAGTLSTTLYLGGQLLARSGGSYFTDSYVPPTYKFTGSATNNNMHMVNDTITAAGATTTVTFSSSSNAAFSGAGDYVCREADSTAASAPSTWTYTSGTSASFTSTNGHVYYVSCVGF